MALERIFSKREIAEMKSQVAFPGTDAYKNLDSVSQDIIDRATDLAARMVADGASKADIEAEKKTLIEGLDDSGKKFVDHVIDAAREKVQDKIKDGSTICTTDGLVLWNNEEKMSNAVMAALEETGHDLSRGNMKELQAYFNYGRVFGALDYEGKGKKVGSRDIEKMVDQIMKEHQTSGERLGQKVRKITKTTGTGLGTVAFGLPLAVIGGTGGFIIGALRKVGHAVVGRDDRDAITAHRRVNSMAQSHEEVNAGYDAIKARKKSYIGKGILWGAGAAGAAGTMLGSGLAKGLASIGLGGKKEEEEAQRIAIRAGIEEGLKARGIGVDEKGKGKGKDEGKEEKDAAKKESTGAQRMAGDDRTYAPGAYYYDSDEGKRKEMLAEIAGALGMDKTKLIESYFRPPQENAFVNIEASSLKQLGNKKAVIAPDFAETPAQLNDQKALMESYKHALEAQGRSDIEVVQIKLEGAKTPQWSVVGKDLTAAQVSFAKEMDNSGFPSVSVMPKEHTHSHAAVAAPEKAAVGHAQPLHDSGTGLEAHIQLLLNEVQALKASQDTMAAQLREMSLGLPGGKGKDGVTSEKVAKGIIVPEVKAAVAPADPTLTRTK